MPREDYRVNGGNLLGQTEKYSFKCLGNESAIDFRVLIKPYDTKSEGDGVLPYFAVARNIWALDLSNHLFSIVENISGKMDGFIRAKIVKDESKILSLEIPDGERGRVLVGIDTGQDQGVTLPQKQWEAWIGEHPKAQITLDASFFPASGVEVRPTVWATEYKIGDLILHDVPLKESSSIEDRVSPGTQCILGLFAVARLSIVLDAERDIAYLTPSKSPPPRYEHNRLGAVFVPRDNGSDDLFAVVAKAGPADVAGVRNGDILIRIDKLDVSKWRSVSGILPLSRFWAMPAGSKHILVVRRGTKTIKIKVILMDILVPSL